MQKSHSKEISNGTTVISIIIRGNVNLRNNVKFSGWRVVVGCFIVMFLTLGVLQTFAVFMPSIIEETGYSAKSIALVSTFATVSAFFANMFVGKFMKKIGIKWTIFIGVIASSVHYLVFGLSTSIYQLYFGAAVGGICTAFSTLAPCTILITNWFIKKRATVISIVIAGSMFGGSVLMPICGYLIQATDWRTTYLILTVIVTIIPTLAILLITESPSDKGEKPYGYDKLTSELREDSASHDAKGVTAEVALKSPSLWILLIGILLIGVSTNTENFLPMFWQKNGMSVATASNYMGIYAFFAAIAAIILGSVSDNLGAKVYIFLTSCLFIIGLTIITVSGTRNIITVFIGLILFAFGAKKTANLIPPLTLEESFGEKDYKSLAGYGAGALQLGIAISNPVIGAMYDDMGSYNIAFLVMVGIGIIALAFIQVGIRISPYRKSLTEKVH